MHYRNVQLFLQSLFYFEAFRSFYVFQIDTSEGRSNGFYRFDKFIRVFFIYFNIEYVNSGINFKQQSLSFHYGFPAHGTYISQAQYGCSVRDNGYQVTFVGIVVCGIRILLDFQTRFCYSR